MGKQDSHQQAFAKNLQYYMDLRGKRQQDIVNDLGISSASISFWCSGTRIPRMDKIEILADYLGISKGDLIDGESETSYVDQSTINKVILLELLDGASADEIKKVIDATKIILRG